jgi:membrane protease YdiL (CAAX protease family)
VGSLRGPRQPPPRTPGLDAGRPEGYPSLPVRATCHAGVLTGPSTAPQHSSPEPARSRRARGNGWGLPEAIIGFAAGLLISLLTAGIAESATGYRPQSTGPIPVAVIAANVGGLWIGLVGAAIFASRRHGTGDVSSDYGFRVATWWDLPLGAAIGLACQYGLVPALYLPFQSFDRSLSQQLSKPVHQDTGSVHTAAAAIVVLLVLAAGAPLVEELFFRGLLLRSLLGRIPVAPAIVASALLFALAHFEAIQFAGLAVFGIVLGYLAWRTGRLGPSIGAHIAFNAAAVLSVVHFH